MRTKPNTPPGELRQVRVCLHGAWLPGWTNGNTDAQERVGIKLRTPAGASDWYLPEYVEEVPPNSPICDKSHSKDA